MSQQYFLITVLSLCFLSNRTAGHGRLIEPPSRSSMWRFGYNTEPNYNDHELFCGGFTAQWRRNGGKCGVCGDAWDAPQPRDNEAGGKYSKGIIVRGYESGQLITSVIEITANHKGYFEFKICPVSSHKEITKQECFDQYPLHLANGAGTKYNLPYLDARYFSVSLKLPDGLSCNHCVFQWTYTSGNNWGRCSNGKYKVGCGPQETFRGCADIRIVQSQNNTISETVTPIPTTPNGNLEKKTETPEEESTFDTTTASSSWHKLIEVTNITREEHLSSEIRNVSIIKRITVANFIPSNSSLFESLKKTSGKETFLLIPVDKSVLLEILNDRERFGNVTSFLVYLTEIPYSKDFLFKILNVTEESSTYVEASANKSESSLSYFPTKYSLVCHPQGVWKMVPGIKTWCNINCARGFCPISHCKCE